MVWGEVSYIGAGLLWGSFTVALRAWRIKPLEGATLAAVLSLPYLVVYALFLEPRIGDVLPVHTITHGVYQGIIFSVFAVVLYGWGISRLGAIAAVATMPLMPVIGATMEWIIIGRTPHYFVAIAIAMITFGVVLTTVNGSRGTAQAES